MIILASQSASRRMMLDAAGVSYHAQPAHVDERALEAQLVGASPSEIARALAEAKALDVGQALPESLVLGSDSLVDIEGRRFDKPLSKDDAAAHLRYFSGKTLHLHSAAALARGNVIIWQHSAVAKMKVRALSDAFIADYLAEEWPAVAGCVGVFRIEARGIQLFEAIEGDHFTILGMPLLPVLGALRDQGELLA